MSGIEIAGLVLGAIPLVLASLEFYADGIAVTKRYLKFKHDFKSMLVELKTENTMCINSITMLLIGVVKPKEMNDFLEDPCGDKWKDPKFEKKLKERLGTTYESYLDTIREMNNVAIVFKQRLKLNDSGQPQFTDQKTFKEHYKRLKFSIQKSDYGDLMSRLKQSNTALHRMTTQTISLEALQQSSKLHRAQAIPKFNVINDRAHGFYSALRSGWKCPCHANHSVSLRLETRMDDVASDDDSEDSDDESMRDPFHVLFRYSHLHAASPTSPGSPKPWTWEEADVRIVEKQSVPTPAASGPGPKGVRFASQARNAVKAALDPNSNMKPIQDLCAAICTLQQPQREVCLELLATEIAKQKYGVHIYPEKDPPQNPEAWTVKSLRHVLQDSKFTRHDRLRLAVTLASSVLQLHETPWLDDNWSKDQIFFIKRSDKTIYDHPFVSQHFNTTQQSTPTPLPAALTRVIRNQTLFALGVSLIELWYGKHLSELHKLEDGPKDTGDIMNDLMTNYATADRLVDELYSEAGGKYSDAVRRCIRCDFDHRAKSLEDATFQKAVYQGVVNQLKENFDFLY
ncbi:hypothetical protein BU24DRAFT_423039 [Aaosphaeria arxii CBS 175.79]|uniref:DUF7580 domain-containing protein n=1 Tax=Aaosphaeria arxii CBS 175.79 TaxID=1450172 RepID=A0A6A5XTZ3_9PLEO|nr:uncharacterized protein BU24DRAFT_423039 [Aaosphaeria arxii CBS 175.79]KAF2016662.1 hypothetical protein BU24DRAFT_423039 [Aaosphaeria arxii CBS 175.79]